MSKECSKTVAEIADTSYSKACEHAVIMAEQGMSPDQVLASISMAGRFDKPTWEDAVYALAYVHRRLPEENAGVAQLVEHRASNPATAVRSRPPAPKKRLAKSKHKPAPVSKRVQEPPQDRRAEKRARTCLKCGSAFHSENAGNRICPRCTQSNRQYAGGDLGGMYA